MLFSYNWLQSFFKGKLPRPEELADLLTMHSFEVEEVKKTGSDFVLDIDVLPNRSHDCFSHMGVAKEIGALINAKFQFSVSKPKQKKSLETKNFVSVDLRNKIACPRYIAAVFTDVGVDDSPKWLKDRLKVCGLRSINNIVDIANYVMLETGQPLHVFNGDKIEGKKIIVRFAKKGEKIVTLGKELYTLAENVLVIADAVKPIAIAGIKGGIVPEVNKSTKVVILESANFAPGVIRNGSIRLGLRTDASLRFEHGIDPNLAELALFRAGFLIQKIAGGKMAERPIDIYQKKIRPKRVRLELDYVSRLLGVKIPEKEIISILKRLGFKILGRSLSGPRKGKKYLLVQAPSYRLDIDIPEDLIEEIGRVYGYEKINPVFPMISSVPPKRNLRVFWGNVVKDILKGVGFTEVYNYSFVSEEIANIFGIDRSIELKNPMNSEQKYLRPSLIPNLLKNVKTNVKETGFQDRQIMIFELGKTFQKFPKGKAEVKTGFVIKEKSFILRENNQLTGLITGDAFYQVKGVVDLLFKELGISNVWYDQYLPKPEESELSIWRPNGSAEIRAGNDKIGFLGEISPLVLDKLKIPKKVSVFDINFEFLSKVASEEHEYMPISRYPAAVRDLAVLVPFKVKVVDVLNKINIAGGSLVRDVDLFDIYENENIPSGKKNLAFHIIYQAKDRTLSSEEINQIQEEIIKVLEENPEWEVRR